MILPCSAGVLLEKATLTLARANGPPSRLRRYRVLKVTGFRSVCSLSTARLKPTGERVCSLSARLLQ